MTEGGGTGASTPNGRSILARFGVLWSPPHHPTGHKPHKKNRGGVQNPGLGLSLPGVEGLFRVRDVRRRCYERSEAAVSASLSRVLSARATAGDHGAGEEEEEEGWGCVGSGQTAIVTLCRANSVQRERVTRGWEVGLSPLPVCGGCGCGNRDGRARVSIHCAGIASSRSPSRREENGPCVLPCAPQQPQFCNGGSAASQGAAAGGLVHVQLSLAVRVR